jgi:hypothetical protein
VRFWEIKPSRTSRGQWFIFSALYYQHVLGVTGQKGVCSWKKSSGNEINPDKVGVAVPGAS